MYGLYEGSLNVVLEPLKAQRYLFFIERAVNRAIIQHERIAYDSFSLKKIMEFRRSTLRRRSIPFFQDVDAAAIRQTRIRTTLFSDIHHYLICWDDVRKLYEQLVKIQPIFEEVPENFLSDLEEHRKFRNHVEHIEGRVERGVTDLGNLSGNLSGLRFSFDGKQLDISDGDLEKLRLFYETLLKIAYEKSEQSFPHS